MAPGLVQAMNQAERGVAYSYYVEHAAEHPAIIGTHWYQWIDQPVTGRRDGENYNIGWIDVTDRPYPELVAAAKATHAKLDDIHSGSLAADHAQAEGVGVRNAGRFDLARDSRDPVRMCWRRWTGTPLLMPSPAIGKQGSRGPHHRRQPGE